jgi:hypothetical protein
MADLTKLLNEIEDICQDDAYSLELIGNYARAIWFPTLMPELRWISEHTSENQGWIAHLAEALLVGNGKGMEDVTELHHHALDKIAIALGDDVADSIRSYLSRSGVRIT